jgi:hypothetical protein
VKAKCGGNLLLEDIAFIDDEKSDFCMRKSNRIKYGY